MAATDPRREQNFRWHNTGLVNTPQTEGEYPVEFLYSEVLSKERLLEALAFFLVYVPKREAEEDRPARPAFTLFPRYHQSRMVRKVADAVAGRFAATGEIGGKYLINHSAGSGKTLSICWLADRLHSLYKPGTSEKLVDMVFVLTDRKSLDKNIKDEIENFAHLKDVVGLAKKAENLPRFLAERKSIVVTTQRKFAWILEEIESGPELKKLRVAFLIDEAHRSQVGTDAANPADPSDQSRRPVSGRSPQRRRCEADARVQKAQAPRLKRSQCMTRPTTRKAAGQRRRCAQRSRVARRPAGQGHTANGCHDARGQARPAEIVGIQLLDHIIFNRNGYFSFLESGYL